MLQLLILIVKPVPGFGTKLALFNVLEGGFGLICQVLCNLLHLGPKFCEMLLRETTAFGVRKTIAERRKLRRKFTEVKTPFGKVTVKIGRLGGKVVQVAPEFETVKKIAAQTGVPVKSVFTATVQMAKNLK